MRKKHDHTNILKVGDKLFRENGYHNTGTEEILEKAEYPRSSFYYHFKSKEGFGVKVVGFYGNNMLNAIKSKLEDDNVKSPLKRLQNYFYMIANYNSETNYVSSCLVQKFAVEEEGEHSGVLQNAAYEQYQTWLSVVEECVASAMELKEIRTDYSNTKIAELLFTTIYGAHSIARLSRNASEINCKLDLVFELIKV